MTDTLIIGAGLCGLSLAEALEKAGHDYLLVEGRNRVGGRILSAPVDLGPSWFWPGQPRMAALVKRLGLRRFDQFATGALTFEDQDGAVQRGRGFASMEGSWRIAGGMAALTDALAAQLPAARVHLKAAVVGMQYEEKGVRVEFADRPAILARRVALALPPRIAASLAFNPPLPDAVRATLADVPTWMAGQAKAVAIYPTPFWREAGLSGDAMSRMGPMVEVHDASPEDASYGALFGFIGVPPAARRDEVALRIAMRAQFSRLFEGEPPTSLRIQDWAADPFTATPADAAPLMAHPAYGLPPAVQSLWDGRLILSGTETAPQFGGFLEGALEAAEAALRVLEGQ
ncbi:flavin monoamine oxidase family protein [Gymnodinialimonas sp.]